MKNGIYLFLILFLGAMCYFVVNDLYKENSITLASGIFLLGSGVIFYLASHLKKKSKLLPIQRIIGAIYISLLALYGVITGLPLLGGLSLESTTFYMEGAMFVVGCLALLYSALYFMKSNIFNNDAYSF
jgi:hypothetical protein